MAFVPDGGVKKLSENQLLVWGEVQKKPEIRDTQSGNKFAKFSVVAGPNDDGEKRYIDCVVFNKSLVNYCVDLERGDPIFVLGVLESRKHNDKTYHNVKVGFMISPVVSYGEEPPFAAPNDFDAGGAPDSGGWAEEDVDDDELPF